jgi:alpha-ketoglutarate-dependent taurine dioxygenase
VKDVKVTKLTPRIGTEITGVQLSQLTDEQKNELALLVAERGVVVFRQQDFKDIGVEKQKEFGQYFGRLHVHVSKRAFEFAPAHSISPWVLMLKVQSNFTTST